jgi:hypothetical protein
MRLAKASKGFQILLLSSDTLSFEIKSQEEVFQDHASPLINLYVLAFLPYSSNTPHKPFLISAMTLPSLSANSE